MLQGLIRRGDKFFNDARIENRIQSDVKIVLCQ